MADAVLQVTVKQGLGFTPNIQLQASPCSALQFYSSASSILAKTFNHHLWSFLILSAHECVNITFFPINCSPEQIVITVAVYLGNCYYVVSDDLNM